MNHRRLMRVCKCGHFKDEHRGFSGPNSIGQWRFHECASGAKAVGEYRVGGCDCYAYKPRLLPVWREAKP